MKDFNHIVNEQMTIMAQIVSLEAELEKEIYALQRVQSLDSQQELEKIKREIGKITEELQNIDHIFTKQTEELIRVYQANHLKI